MMMEASRTSDTRLPAEACMLGPAIKKVFSRGVSYLKSAACQVQCPESSLLALDTLDYNAMLYSSNCKQP
eukprot:1158011-Pelagomonas_calceolata.AAC.5